MDNYTDKFVDRREGESQFPHYYGDIVRKQLIFAGVVVLLAGLLDTELQSFYLFIAVFGVLTFVVLAGLTSPLKPSVMIANSVISGVMFLFFEYFALSAYAHYGDFANRVFLLRQLLSVVFLLTLYFSTKTIREMRVN